MIVDGVASFSVVSPVNGACVSCKVELVVASGIQISVIVLELLSFPALEMTSLRFSVSKWYCISVTGSNL